MGREGRGAKGAGRAIGANGAVLEVLEVLEVLRALQKFGLQTVPQPRNMKYTAPSRQNPAHRKSSFIGCFMYRTAKGTKTPSVITSCRILSCERLRVE